MKRPSCSQAPARGAGKQFHRCIACGEVGHRVETCSHPAAVRIRALTQEVKKLKGTKRVKDVKRVEHKRRKSSKVSGSWAREASRKYVGKPAARLKTPAETRRLLPTTEFSSLPVSEEEAVEWLQAKRVLKAPGKCKHCSGNTWSDIIWPSTRGSVHHRCLKCGARFLVSTMK